MYKIINKSLLIVSLILFSLSITAQDRNVIWLHGFNGEASHWEHYENIFNIERQINSVNEGYNSSWGVDYATDSTLLNISNELGYYQGTNPNNLGIGHSMGGIVLRNLDMRNSQRTGGYITVDSPNYGAPVIHAINNGTLLSTVQDACNKLSDGPIAELFSLPYNIIGNLYNDDICNSFIDNTLVDELIEQEIGGEQTIEDLTPNSTILNSINTHSSNQPRISIWGEETSPVHWQLFGSVMVLNGSSGYTNQDDFVDDINASRGVYNGFVVSHRGLALNYALVGLFGLSAYHYYVADQWANGRDWIDDSEDVWCSLIETTRSETETYWVEVWVPCDDPFPLKSSETTKSSNYIDPDCGDWVWEQRTRLVSVNYPSDGFLPQYTQELQGIVSGNRYSILGANHLELLDMSNSVVNGVLVDGTKNTFNDIYNRDDFFKTLAR